jgi:hypothetical protein
MQYRGKAWKVIKCPNCLKYFKSEYMKQYHLDNAKTLCPKYEEKKANDSQIHQAN